MQAPTGRDLGSYEVWERSLERSRHRRLTALRQRRKEKGRRRASTLMTLAALGGVTAPAASLAHYGSTASGVAKSYKRLLKLGDRGARVAQLQRLLGIPADGVFGPQTQRAVRAFQKKRGLAVDGIVGLQTWRALTSGGGAKRANGLLELGDRGARVAQLQRLLGIPADGVFGRQTQRAVRAFQARRGLTVDGVVGPQTWRALTSGGTSGGGSSSSTTSNATSRGRASIDRRLWPALALAERMGLRLMSAHRSGASIAGSARRSDHSYYPSKAIDVGGSASNMSRYARAVAGTGGVEIVIYGPVGIWSSGLGWRAVSSSITYRDHLDHVHVDTF
ncbi:MAG: peptidoglycan-binding protein [Chloroflexota bacterium]|nr:peptidoglycan-binding protein [Chloroflexota bacterium]